MFDPKELEQRRQGLRHTEIEHDQSAPDPDFYNTLTTQFQKRYFSSNMENWLETFYDITFPTEMVILSRDEIQTIKHAYEELYKSQVKTTSSETNQKLDIIAGRLQCVIDKFNSNCEDQERGVFLKLSCRSPKDGIYNDPEFAPVYHQVLKRLEKDGFGSSSSLNTKAMAVMRAFIEMMKTSDARKSLYNRFIRSSRVYVDMMWALESNVDISISVRKWKNLPYDTEFRCFVFRDQITAISQYFAEIYSSRIVQNKNRLEKAMLRFFDENIKPRIETSENLKKQIRYNLDFIVCLGKNEDDDQVHLIEMNPIEDSTDPCLFNWKNEGNILRNGPYEFRVRETQHSDENLLRVLPQEWRKFLEIQGEIE
eukprot:gb/GECH01005725.1/.p1 GENE.gb/GECH01005725.1/~~gb/GECH01005725.1/.p1  ORF type:complete len:368 (+),score=101.81 gb/GECH01005725.1/:1-1104(+)